MSGRRPARAYRGGKNRTVSAPAPVKAERTASLATPLSLSTVRRDVLGDRRTIDLAFDPSQKRDSNGRWTEKAASEVKVGDFLDPSRKTRVHAVMSRNGNTTLAYKVKGSKSPGIYRHADAERVRVYHVPSVDLAFDPAQKRDAQGRWTYRHLITKSGGGWEGHKVAAFDAEGVVHAVVEWGGSNSTGTINSLWTDPDYRRQGLASEVVARARTIVPDLGHSAERSDLGDRFARSTGKPVPRRRKRETADDAEQMGRSAARIAQGQYEAFKTGKRGSFITPTIVDLAFDPAQKRDAQGQWTIDPTNIVKRWMQATPGERTAGKDWYPAAHRTAVALSKKYNIPVKEAAGLLAAYSPQTPWGRNQVEASESLRYGHAVGGPKAALWYQHDDPGFLDRVGIMATGQTRGLAQRVMDGQDFDTASAGRNKNGSVKPKALKIRAFYDLIANGGQGDPENPRVVIDRHAMSVAYGQRVDEKTYEKMHPGSGAKYAPFVEAYKIAAAQISATEGTTVTPEQLQATTWLTQQRLNQSENTRVGKTRKTLGNKDWAEWLQYANNYLGLGFEDGAKVGYSNLSALGLQDIDLAFNPNQRRGPDGKWARSLGSPLTSLVDEVKSHRAAGQAKTPLARKARSIKDYTRLSTWPVIDEPDDKMDWGDGNTKYDPETEMPAASPEEATSLWWQSHAQIKAKKWYDGGDSGGRDTWRDYQNPDKYGIINGLLRGTDKDPDLTPFTDQVKGDVKEMFDEAGLTTTQPTTLYRALRTSKGLDWAQTLRTGSTFQENGIASTTAFRRMAQGWLGLNGTSSDKEGRVNSDDVVMEIRVPKGSKIVGGDPQFIETMLPPGTKFKVIHAGRIRTKNAVNPLGGSTIKKAMTYTHITVEAILPEEYGGPHAA